MERAPYDGTEILIYVHSTFRRAKFFCIGSFSSVSIGVQHLTQFNEGCWVLIDDTGNVIAGCTVSKQEPSGWLPWTN